MNRLGGDAQPARESNDAPLQESKRMLDALWLVIAFVALAALGIPWFLRFVNLDLAPAVWTVFSFSLFYWLASRAFDRIGAARRSSVLHALGIGFLALVWHLAGGIGNPSFLMVFALPVVAARLLEGRIHPYISAGLATAAVSLFALCESPELRWYATLAIPGSDALLGWLPVLQNPLGVRPDPGELAFGLLLFGVLLTALALVVDSVDTHLFGAHRRLRKADVDLHKAEQLWRRILEAQPNPAALVFSDTGRLIEANPSFQALLPAESNSVVELGLADLAGLRDPERVVEALRRNASGIQCERAADRGGARLLRLDTRRVGGAASNTCLVFLRDLTEEFFLRKAADASDSPLMLLDGSGRLAYFNAAAERAVEGLHPGVHVADAFGRQRAGANWWEPGPSGRARRRLRLPSGLFEARVAQFSFPDGWATFHSVSLSGPLPEPAASGASLESMSA